MPIGPLKRVKLQLGLIVPLSSLNEPSPSANAKAVSIIASRFICKISEREMSPQLSSGRKGQAHACD
jgi:hypothetical protein